MIARLVDGLPPGGGVDVVVEGDGPAVGLPFELLRLSTPQGVDLGPVSLAGGVTITRRPSGTATAATPLPGPLKILAAIAAPDETKTPNTPLMVGWPAGISPAGSHGSVYVDLNINGCMSSPRLC